MDASLLAQPMIALIDKIISDYEGFTDVTAEAVMLVICDPKLLQASVPKEAWDEFVRNKDYRRKVLDQVICSLDYRTRTIENALHRVRFQH